MPQYLEYCTVSKNFEDLVIKMAVIWGLKNKERKIKNKERKAECTLSNGFSYI